MNLSPHLKTLTLFFMIMLTGVSSQAKVVDSELSAMLTNAEIWEDNPKSFIKQFTSIDWGKVEGQEVYYSKNKGLSLWGTKVARVRLSNTLGVLSGVSIKILNQEAARDLSKEAFNKHAIQWKKLVDKKLGSSGRGLSSVSYGRIKERRVGWKSKDGIFILSASAGSEPYELVLSFHEEKAGLVKIKLKGQQEEGDSDNERAENRDSKITTKDENEEDIDLSKDEGEIRSKIREISARKAPDGISRKVQDAVNLLNVYRYLSGVPSDVKASKSMCEDSEDAAKICKVKGKLGHDFGHSTDKCNLAMNSGGLSMEESVVQYMDDFGANNRAKRGHRRWCLNHKMGETGFGLDDGYSAMYSVDQSGRAIKKNYSYPGHGYYPIKYLHGNGWSYYSTSGKIPTDCKVLVWKLSKKEDEIPAWSKEPDGKQLPCAYVNVYLNSVVFEPEKSPITKKGYYLVRIKGRGLKEQYLVKLF